MHHVRLGRETFFFTRTVSRLPIDVACALPRAAIDNATAIGRPDRALAAAGGGGERRQRPPREVVQPQTDRAFADLQNGALRRRAIARLPRSRVSGSEQRLDDAGAIDPDQSLRITRRPTGEVGQRAVGRDDVVGRPFVLDPGQLRQRDRRNVVDCRLGDRATALRTARRAGRRRDVPAARISVCRRRSATLRRAPVAWS